MTKPERNPKDKIRRSEQQTSKSAAAFFDLRASSFAICHLPSELMQESPFIRVRRGLRPLFWPLLALAVLLLFNLVFTAGFARITIRDGHFYGSLVDIAKLSSRV